MSKIKKTKIKTVDFEKAIMSKVKSNELTMKPRWYFVVGSVFTLIGFVTFTIVAVYLTNLILFIVRKHGPMGQFHLEQALNSFPWWLPVLIIVGIVGGFFFLRKYEFSYKKNTWLIVVGFLISVIFAGYLMDTLGLNDIWSQQEPMKGFYHQLQGQNNNFQRRQGMREQGRVFNR
jgi:hypothetical protein